MTALRSLGILPYIIGGLFMFMAGGQLIGGFRVHKERIRAEQMQSQIVANAVKQAQGLAERWEKENSKSRALQRELDRLQGKLNEADAEIDQATRDRQDALNMAKTKLTQCLVDPDVIDVLNDWTKDAEEYPDYFTGS